MFKKLIKLFSIASLLFVFTLIMTSCGNGTHTTHSYTTTKSNETKHWKECSCGDKKDEEDHTFGEWTTTKEPTTTTTGTKERVCSVCKYKETDTTPILEPNVKDIAELIAKYPNQLKSFLENEMIDDMFYLPTEKDYVDLDLVYASWYLGRITDDKLTYVSLAFTVKLDETKRGYYVTDSKFEDNPIDLDLIAKYDKTSSTNKFFPDGIWVGQVESLTVLYDAKEKQNDSKFLDDLYGSGALREDVITIDYVNETFQTDNHTHSYTITKFNETKHWKECSCGEKSEEENHSFGEWTTIKEATYTEKGQKKRECSKCDYEETEDIAIKETTDISTVIKDNNDIINASLETHYVNAVKKAYGRYYDTDRFTMTSYRWDLGEVVDGKIQNLKVILYYHNNVASVDVLHVHNVIFNEAIELSTLLDVTIMSNIKATYSSEYSYTYDATKQHDMDEVWAKLAELELNEFNYESVLYTRTGGSVEFGEASGYTISYIEKSSIKEITVIIKDASTNSGWLGNLQNGNYKVYDLKEIDFTSNQLKEVIADKKFTIVDTAEDGFVFSFDGTEWYLTSYVGSNQNIVLPETYKDMEYSIFRKAFFYKDIKTIKFPEKLKEIGNDVFAGCKNLVFVNTLNSIKIGICAFAGCDSIESITIGPDTQIIYDGAFRGCKNLNNVNLGSKVERIGGGAFHGCLKLTSITIPASVIELGTTRYSAFNSIKTATFLSKTGWKGFGSGTSQYQLVNIDSSKLSNPTEAAEYIKGYMTKE